MKFKLFERDHSSFVENVSWIWFSFLYMLEERGEGHKALFGISFSIVCL